ncbi:MAG: DUF357 domain-containing protein [Candidatus Altiarchaeota archaeon]
MQKNLKKKVSLYLEKATPLFENIQLCKPENFDLNRISYEFYEMAICYYKDAKHFFSKGEYENALAALEYAEGWLDAGRKLGIFKIKEKK